MLGNAGSLAENHRGHDSGAYSYKKLSYRSLSAIFFEVVRGKRGRLLEAHFYSSYLSDTERYEPGA